MMIEGIWKDLIDFTIFKDIFRLVRDFTLFLIIAIILEPKKSKGE